ncbi:hypothetical protein [Marinomonas sp. 2405UD68-3]|uniref:hypothetical protein n=1 Tax=Marinomonas sp. 2405UD68-3 TaxID=3391835 RepID=UPI0039C91D7E
MKKINASVLVCVCVVGMGASVSHANEAVDKAADAMGNFFGKVKEVAVETANNVAEKGSEIGTEASARAKESGEILWDKAKKVGESASDLFDRVKGDDCDLKKEECAEKSVK